MSWFWSSGGRGSILTQIKKNAAAKYNKACTVFTCQSSTINRVPAILTITKHVVSPILTSKIRYYYVLAGLLRFLEHEKCFLNFHLIINLLMHPKITTSLIRHHSLISSLSGPELDKGEQ